MSFYSWNVDERERSQTDEHQPGKGHWGELNHASGSLQRGERGGNDVGSGWYVAMEIVHNCNVALTHYLKCMCVRVCGFEKTERRVSECACVCLVKMLTCKTIERALWLLIPANDNNIKKRGRGSPANEEALGVYTDRPHTAQQFLPLDAPRRRQYHNDSIINSINTIYVTAPGSGHLCSRLICPIHDRNFEHGIKNNFWDKKLTKNEKIRQKNTLNLLRH